MTSEEHTVGAACHPQADAIKDGEEVDIASNAFNAIKAAVSEVVPTWDKRRGDRMLLKLPRPLADQFRSLRLQIGEALLPEWSLEDFSLKWDDKERAFEVTSNPMLRPMVKKLLGAAQLDPCWALVHDDGKSWSLVIKATVPLAPFGQKGGIDPHQYTQCLEGTACQYQSQHVYLPAAATRSLQFLKQGEPWPPIMGVMAAFTLNGQLIPIQQPVLLKTVKATARYDMQGWQGARLILKHATLRCCSRWLLPPTADGEDGSGTNMPEVAKHEGYVIQPGLLVFEAVNVDQKQAGPSSGAGAGDGCGQGNGSQADAPAAGQQESPSATAAGAAAIAPLQPSNSPLASGPGSGGRWGAVTRISRRDYEGSTIIDSSLPAYFTYSTLRPTVNLLADLQLLDRDIPDDARPVLWAWVAVERDGDLHPTATYVKFTPQQTLHLYCMSGWKGIGKLLTGIDPAVRLERWIRPAQATTSPVPDGGPSNGPAGRHAAGTSSIRRYAPPSELLVVRAVTSTQPYKFETEVGQEMQEAGSISEAAGTELDVAPAADGQQVSGGNVHPQEEQGVVHEHQPGLQHTTDHAPGSNEQQTAANAGRSQQASITLHPTGTKRTTPDPCAEQTAGVRPGLLLGPGQRAATGGGEEQQQQPGKVARRD